jgi:hypothetical protein
MNALFHTLFGYNFYFRLRVSVHCVQYTVFYLEVFEKLNLKQFPQLSQFSTVFQYNFNHGSAEKKSNLPISPDGRISTGKMDHKLFSK